MRNKILIAGGFLSISIINAQQETTNQVTPSSSSYGLDMSFSHTGAKAISTNYAWLPHNIDPENNPTPEEYKDMPVQTLGNRQQVYEDYLNGCRHYWEERMNHGKDEQDRDRGIGVRACNQFENDRIDQNIFQPMSMVNYTDVGYKKIKAPKEVFKMISDFWEANKDRESDEDWGEGNVFVNYWENPSKMINVDNEELEGGGEELHDSIWNVTRDIIQEWTGQQLEGSSVYGIRVYKEGAILSPHVDRLPLISSAIINVAQDIDEEWPLEVIGHDGKATNVTMEPGDMVLYESHSVLHGRPFALKGRFYANIFIHFMPIPTEQQIHEHELPPYILKDSIVAKEWDRGEFEDEIPGAPRKKFYEYDGPPKEDWGQHEAHNAAGDGDLDALIEIAKEDSEGLHAIDHNGWQPIHEAVRSGEEDVIEFLKEQGADLNSITDSGAGGLSVLDIAIKEWGDDHEFIDWLKSLGATLTKFDMGPEL